MLAKGRPAGETEHLTEFSATGPTAAQVGSCPGKAPQAQALLGGDWYHFQEIINRTVTADNRGAPLLGRKKEVGHQYPERGWRGGTPPDLQGAERATGVALDSRGW